MRDDKKGTCAARSWHEGHAADHIKTLLLEKQNKKISVRALEEAMRMDKRVPTKEECEEMVVGRDDDESRRLKMFFAYLGELLDGGRYGGLR